MRNIELRKNRKLVMFEKRHFEFKSHCPDDPRCSMVLEYVQQHLSHIYIYTYIHIPNVGKYTMEPMAYGKIMENQ